MSNEAQYINPIIQAMISSAQIHQGKEELKQRALQAKADEDLRSRAQDAHEKQIEYEHQQAQDMLTKYHLPMLQATLQKASMDARDHVQRALASGVDPSAFRHPDQQIQGGGIPGIGDIPDFTKPGTPAGMLTLPGTGENIPISAFPDPTKASSIAANRIAADTAAKAGAELPFQLQLANLHYNNQSALQQQAQDFQSKNLDKQLEASKLKDQFDKATQLQIAGMTLGSHEKIAMMEHGITPEQLQSGVVQAMTGMRKFTSDNIYDRNIMQTLEASGGRPLDPKEADTLKQLNGLGQTFDKMEGFITKNLPSEKKEGSLAATGKAYAQGLIAKSGLPTDIKTDFDTIKSDALRVGRGLEGMTGGRVLSKQLDLDLNSLVGPGITQEQALRKLQSLKNQYINQEQNVIMGGLPDVQKKAIIQKYGLQQPSGTDTGTLPIGQRPPGIPAPPITPKQQWVRDGKGNIIPAPPQPPANVPLGN